MKKKVYEMGLYYDAKIKDHLRKVFGPDFSSLPKQKLQVEVEKLTNQLLDQHCA